MSDKPKNRVIGTVIDPSHYHSGGIEVIEVIEAFFPDDPHLSHALKYMCRAGRKAGASKAEDIRKSRWWVDRAIEFYEKQDKEKNGIK